MQIIELKEPLGRPPNGAALVRMEGIKAATTEWIAFVDDDDVVTPNYVARLEHEIRVNPDVDQVIFRMTDRTGMDGVLPPPHSETFYARAVGISFATKKCVFEHVAFNPGCMEDYEFLRDARVHPKQFMVVMSPVVTYLIRAEKWMSNPADYVQPAAHPCSWTRVVTTGVAWHVTDLSGRSITRATYGSDVDTMDVTRLLMSKLVAIPGAKHALQRAAEIAVNDDTFNAPISIVCSKAPKCLKIWLGDDSEPAVVCAYGSNRYIANVLVPMSPAL